MDPNLSALYQERGVANNASAALARANATIRRIDGENSQWAQVVKDRDARIAELELALAQSKARSAGLSAYLGLFKTEHPTSPTWRPLASGSRTGASRLEVE